MDDVRYSELIFLQKLAEGAPGFDLFYGHHGDQAKVVGLPSHMYVDMAVTLLEGLFIRFHDQHLDLLVARLRGEVPPNSPGPFELLGSEWGYPRQAIYSYLTRQNLYQLRITYRGLRRIEELRELLRRDRILEHFGVLLDLRYVHTDLQDALQRPSDTPISVLYADLDRFKPINDEFGHAAGDVVLKAYLEVVHNSLGSFGTGYRGRGDEVVAIITGQGHERAVQLAEKIRKAVEALECEHNGKRLLNVTASIGVATTPPESRTAEIEAVAEERNRQAKATGRNWVIAAP
jgi:diguanylate cyclase (GGDEF)-like protein